MTVNPASAANGLPLTWETYFFKGSASGLQAINPGDWLAWSANNIIPTNAGDKAFWKASGIGVALEANPLYDPAGRQINNSALLIGAGGVFRVTAAFSGQPAYGVGAYPVATGSGVNAPTGLTGVGATWQTGIKLITSGGTGAGGSGVALVINWYNNGAAGTGQMDILVVPPRPDYY